MEERILNITNGDCFNEYFLTGFGGEAVPFCEAMMDGDGVSPIFSEAFVAKRCECLGIGEEEYRSKMQFPFALGKMPARLCLWFGKDTFCQMNLLTLLAYLEQIGYGGEIELKLIDDESFAVIGEKSVSLGLYKKRYEEILIGKKMPASFGCLEEKAVELYFDYHSPDGFLADLVRENSDLEEMDLLCLLLEKSADYGLSDLQAQKLIRRVRSW